jgi:hypothetical protein
VDHVEACARAAHEANRAYVMAVEGIVEPHWEDAPDWQRESCRKGVEGALRGATPEQSHESWLEEKRRTGWAWGPSKDSVLKTHPCCLPYGELPKAQRRKDGLYLAVVRAINAALEGI